ncbi:hypothetical protein ADK53_13055 [Streptomyces sp. WM6373]|uniref:hypothetical protein n=1 Tax=Streptomyces TaxID=1883 RepID=UPI0004C5C782|nr:MULTISPECIES: hypothetical protein [unclassified Streptomyces]KJY23362.1 hypothetical protein VR43_01880 [Streptomyces sp. NRRL S-104]KOU36597.1 hypothetical protein ADK53_13055 [Streptomyces sp. WM6373]KOU65555.1 hypothetical protein ADK96_17025 [Streptomyces sp. IGB124]KOU74670.1 hypothetical protein ADK61_19540 [Streptomyces sp. XY66]KOU87620.1 hypothetical protein ADK93_15800 [Streptomyces sp. XY58]
MAIADDLKKTLTDPTPLYFAAGTADLAVQQAKKVPELIEQLRAEAPARIEAVKNTDPKAVQDAVTAKVAEVLGAIDPKKIGETAQDLALRGVGVAAEYAVRAKETYDKVAEHGEQAVRAWRGEVSEEIVDIAVVVEPRPEPKAEAEPAAEPAAGAAADEQPAAKKPATRRSTAKKAVVTADDAS